ncbi:MAG TPA: hypothetical protein VII75_00090, partial [Thermoanaerobaculia bacterium]
DRVVVRMSPQSLPHLAGMNLVNEARIDFDQLLNNVIASGASDHPAVIRNVLKELLAGWLSEIRTEFGPEMEAEVRKITV